MASEYELPPDSDVDFVNADRGYINKVDRCLLKSSIKATKDEVVWDNDAYKFITDPCPETAHPSLWRQSQLCYKQGLYEVVKNAIYQVRGLDLANVTFVETINSSGVIVIDPLCSYETAKAALELYTNERKGKTIVAIIYTHSHADHFGGASAIIEVAPKGVPVYAPEGFLEHAVAENVYAGNAMNRRAVYMYGVTLAKSPTGQIGTGLGMNFSTGVIGLTGPTQGCTISKTGTLAKPEYIGDLRIVWQMTPGTEAPSEMNFYLPDYNALCMAENATYTQHNIQTLRGALVRDARIWSYYMDESLVLFGKDVEVAFASHHWPTWDNANIVGFLSNQRDLYAYLHKETLRQLNAGQTGLEIAEEFKLPDSLNNLWSARGYYGSVSHNVKAIYNRYMGWFDGNPVNLWEHPPVEASKRTELATIYTRLGYGAENATWRNFYLTGAKELTGAITKTTAISTDSLMALDIEQLVDTMAIRINGPQAAGAVFTIDFQVEDLDVGRHLNMSNSVLTHHPTMFSASTHDAESASTLTVWCSHQELVKLVVGLSKDFSNATKVVGDQKVWETLTSLLTSPDASFAIVTPEVDAPAQKH